VTSSSSLLGLEVNKTKARTVAKADMRNRRRVSGSMLIYLLMLMIYVTKQGGTWRCSRNAERGVP
jgi:hypothetical protein